jgi:hypothetical protein
VAEAVEWRFYNNNINYNINYWMCLRYILVLYLFPLLTFVCLL